VLDLRTPAAEDATREVYPLFELPATAYDDCVQEVEPEPALELTTRPAEVVDTPLERLELLAGDDAAISDFLDELDVRGPREREMLAELARTTSVANPVALATAHRRLVAALESLSRHGYAGSSAGDHLGPLKHVARFLIELVARYIVVSYLRKTVTSLRNLYWLREIEAPEDCSGLDSVRSAREDAETLDTVFAGREIGLPTFVIGGVLIPVAISAWNLSSRVALANWWAAAIGGVVSVLMVLGISWILLRGAAMANRRIRLAAEQPLQAVWDAVGHCGRPPKNQSRKFALVGIGLSVGGWIVLPILIGIALAT
jgi:plasmid stabilization system protein ParE